MRIALTGLDAAQTGLATTGNNISNANSPGYSRETVQQAAQVPAGQTGLIQGTGVTVTGITRSFSQFAESRLWQANADAGSASQMKSSMDRLNNLLSTSSGSLTPALSGFFKAAQTLAGNPSGAVERQAFLGAAQTLSDRFNALGDNISRQRADISSQINSAVGQINTLTSEIAKLNVKIGSMRGGSPGSKPNGLLDQRDHLVKKLSHLVGVSVTKQSNGSLSVFTGNGQTLVAGAKAFKLGTRPNALDGTNLDVVYEPSGAVVSKGIRGGTLGGLFSARSKVEQAGNRLGQIAVALTHAVNRQQSLGLDANGNLGGPLFSVPAPKTRAASTNTGSATVTASVSNSQAVTAHDYQLHYQGGAWTVTTRQGGKSVSFTQSGNTLSFDGLSVTVSGTPANGDSFLVQPTASAASGVSTVLSDPSGIAAAAPYVSNAGSINSNGALVNNNTGNVTVSSGQTTATPAGNAAVIPASDFGKTLTIKFTGSNSYQVSDSGGVVASGSYSSSSGGHVAVKYPSPPGPSGEYWQVALTGTTPQTGDSYVLQPAGTGDNRNATALGALGNSSLVGGSATFSGSYATLTGTVGDAGQHAKLSDQAAQGALAQATKSQQSVSGVNMNEEAANLLKYQEAFQASAKAIGTADKLFQSILGL